MKNDLTIRIAYAEDHRLIRKAVAGMIQAANHNFKVIIDVDNGQQLLESIDRSALQPDVCLLDITMPVMDGFETMQHLTEKYPYIRCLAVSAHGNDYSILKMIRNGALGYVTKNASPAELNDAITEVFNNRFYVCDEVYNLVPRIKQEGAHACDKPLFKDREVEFLAMCCSDLTYPEIGKKMNLSARTIESYCNRLRDKLNIDTRLGLAMYALKAGIGSFSNNRIYKSVRNSSVGFRSLNKAHAPH